MFQHILVAYDGTPGSEQALKAALALARLTGARITAISVVEKLPAYAASVGEVEETKREMDAYFARIQATGKERALSQGVPFDGVLRAGQAAQTIVRYAEEKNLDLIVVGANGRRGLGGTADHIAEQAHCSVLIVRATPLMLPVREVMSRNVATVDPHTPLSDVFTLLIQRQLKAVPVVDAGKVVGIITGGDLLQRAGMRLRLSLQRSLPSDLLQPQVRELAEEGRTALDVMSSPVVTIREDAKVWEAIRIMTERHFKRLPVVDTQGGLLGIISRLDVLAAIATAARGEETLPVSLGQLPETARDVMIRDVPSVGPDTALNEILNTLVATPLRRVVVVDGLRRVVGIIVDADLLQRVGHRAAPGIFQALVGHLAGAGTPTLDFTGTAADIMERKVYTVREDAPLAEVLQVMLEHRLKRIVVLDTEGRLTGMVDRANLLQVVAAGLGAAE